MSHYVNLDSAETLFFERELESRKSQTYDIVRAPLKAFELIPVDSSAGAGAESIVYEQYDGTGLAKIIGNYADDLPRADVKGREFVARVKSVGNSYGYSLQEIRAAQFAGKGLEQRKASFAARGQRETWNRIAFFGDEEHGIPGWLTNQNIPAAPVANDGDGDSTEWADKTPEQIKRDVNEAITSVISVTNGAEQIDTVVFAITPYRFLQTANSGQGTDTSLLAQLQADNPGVTFEWANELDGAFTGGSNGFIAYRRSPDAMTLEMPQMFEQLPVQERGLEFVVPCHSRIAGVLVYYPLSQAIRYGI